MGNSDGHAHESHHAAVHLHTQYRIAAVDERIFGGFLEHLGRAVYEGVFDPGNPLSDERGFRRDVIGVLRDLRMPMVRYPGGNFVSNHDWRHSVGPREQRPRRPDFAWRSIETHHFGVDEFMAWCSELGTAPMMAVNLGTGTAADAAALVEYCNLPTGTSYADERAANGHADPYRVAMWCLGNEMDGPWQAGHSSAATYAERAGAASRLMKGLDPSIETVVCGSSARTSPTYLDWDRVVLEHCWDTVDFLSVHRYSTNRADDTPTFLAEGVVIDSMLDDFRGVLGYVGARRHGSHEVRVCFDEWNVWYRETGSDGAFAEAPHLLEERYNVEDALVCAQYLNSFIRNADLVTAACLAQIVNVIAPVLTRSDGVLLQTIYWPFKLLRDSMCGDALRTIVHAPEMSTGRGDVPVIDVAATHDVAARAASISIVNRDPVHSMQVAIHLEGAAFDIDGAQTLTGDPKTANDWEEPNRVHPTALGVRIDEQGVIHAQLAGPSHTVITLRQRAST